MKKLIIALALTVATSTVIADLSDCEKIGTFSSTVMSSRQIGIPMSSVMAITAGYEGHLMSNIVREAWTHPIETGVLDQNRMTESFKNEQLVTCYRVMTD